VVDAYEYSIEMSFVNDEMASERSVSILWIQGGANPAMAPVGSIPVEFDPVRSEL